MAVNQVIYNGETIVDLTGDSVTPETLLEGTTAHSANGEKIVGTLSIQSITESVLAQVLERDKAKYPVGAIYISTASTNPATLLGFGTWEQIKDTFLLAAGSTYAAGSTGGEATHTLTTNEMPSHHHTSHGISIYTTGNQVNLALRSVELGQQHTGTAVMRVNNTGGGKAHNNMPPYLAVYVWKRTA